MNEPIDLHTIIIIITFLMLMIFVAYFLKSRKEQIQSHFNKTQKMSVTSSLLLGGGNKALLINIDHREFLLITGKNQQSSILSLSEASSIKIKRDLKKERI